METEHGDALKSPRSQRIDESRVTMKDVAEAAGVSPSTVCRALNSNPQIPKATREKVQKVADELGYQVDPLLSAFALRRRGKSNDSSITTIAYITNFGTRDEWTKNPFYQACFEGVQNRVKRQGYRVEHFWLGEENMSPKRLSRILYNRGILGVCVAPMKNVSELVDLEWERFCGVTIGYSMQSPNLHRTAPHHFHGIQQMIQTLYAKGYRRIGLSIFSDTSRRVDELWLSGALLVQNRRILMNEKKNDDVVLRTFLFNDENLKEVPKWVREENLEVVISDNDRIAQMLAQENIRVPGDVDFATLNWEVEKPQFAGINQRPGDIGAAAMDLLIGQIQRGELGVPAVPLTTMVEGVWVDGPSLRKNGI
tara:strand:- start:21706 stop:22806 length:1101 start_codon:yes stop_codon:yes gene_type:complete